MGISGLPIFFAFKRAPFKGGSLLQLGALYKAGKGKKGKQQIEAAQREADGADDGRSGEQVYGLPGWLGSNTTWIICKIGIEYTTGSNWLFRGKSIIWGLYDIGDYDIGFEGMNNQTLLFFGGTFFLKNL